MPLNLTALKTSFTSGLSALASAITAKGVTTAPTDTLQTLTTKIGSISTDVDQNFKLYNFYWAAYVSTPSVSSFDYYNMPLPAEIGTDWSFVTAQAKARWFSGQSSMANYIDTVYGATTAAGNIITNNLKTSKFVTSISSFPKNNVGSILDVYGASQQGSPNPTEAMFLRFETTKRSLRNLQLIPASVSYSCLQPTFLTELFIVFAVPN
jgi:hypothetical protein